MADDQAQVRPEEPADRISQAPRTMTSTDPYGVLSRSTLLRHALFTVVGLVVVLAIVKGLSDAKAFEYVLIPRTPAPRSASRFSSGCPARSRWATARS